MAPMDQVVQGAPKLCPLSRPAAQEFVLLAVLAPFMVSDLAARMDSVIYATDASERKGVCGAMQLRKLPGPCGGLVGRKHLTCGF